ncbi:hypothetical protein [Candidatus Burkholderia verschuerenii]|uniref:hypothetical protein n=1 Tax=Candidatus Burkholderia verschuerenii TaxID=242163 RepID=UPI000A52A284|nr:hypothetical protein [Candidatus Burkholderia verschuerenii]
MNFGLLLSQLPRVDESRAHYDALLDLQVQETREPRLRAFWRHVSAIFLHR